MEKLIDTENFDEVNGAFEDAYAQLAVIAKKKGGMKTQRDVKRAMKALKKVEIRVEKIQKNLTNLSQELHQILTK